MKYTLLAILIVVSLNCFWSCKEKPFVVYNKPIYRWNKDSTIMYVNWDSKEGGTIYFPNKPYPCIQDGYGNFIILKNYKLDYWLKDIIK